jgi:hypothetical protein
MARHGSGRRRGVGVHGPSRTTAGGVVVEDAGSAVARPVDAPEPHGSLVLGVVVAPLVSDGFLLAQPSSTSTSARRRPASLPARWRSTRHDTGGSARWRLAPVLALDSGRVARRRRARKLPFSFPSPSFTPPSFTATGQRSQRGETPKEIWFAPGASPGVLLRAEVTATGNPRGPGLSPLPLPWRRRRRARSAGEIGGRNLPGANPWFLGVEGVWSPRRAGISLVCAPAGRRGRPGARARVRIGGAVRGACSGQRGRKKNRGGPRAGPAWR